jgi:hypothetical protein
MRFRSGIFLSVLAREAFQPDFLEAKPLSSVELWILQAHNYEVEGRIIFAAIFTTKLLGATRSDSIISRFIAPEIT